MKQVLRYGENPHQPASWKPNKFISWKQHQGKDLSYTNLLDLNAAVRIVVEFDEPAAVVVKHTNPCGVAIGNCAAQAYVLARDADIMSSYGGIVGLNQVLDVETAALISTTFVECVIAPAVSDEAVDILKKKENLRVITVDYGQLHSVIAFQQEVLQIAIGTLRQEQDYALEACTTSRFALIEKIVTKRVPTVMEWAALRFVWRVCAHVKSNAIVIGSADRTLGIGGGQPNRLDSAKIAAGYLKHPGGYLLPGGPAAASDAFFPFRDGLEILAKAGVKAVVQPGGSIRDPEVIEAANNHDITMVFVGRRHFRH